MRALFAAAILLTTHAASADVVIYNATQSKMKVDVTQPNGRVTTATLDEAVDSIDEEKWTFGYGVKTVKIAITDDSGAAVWSGSVGSNDAGVIVSTAKGAAYVPSGTYSGADEWRAAAFMNITGDAVTIDLEGRNGLGAHRGIVPAASFDLKKAIKLDARETYFSVIVRPKGADPIELESVSLSPGRYNVLWKRSRDGAYRLLAAGYLPPPPKPKAKR